MSLYFQIQISPKLMRNIYVNFFFNLEFTSEKKKIQNYKVITPVGEVSYCSKYLHQKYIEITCLMSLNNYTEQKLVQIEIIFNIYLTNGEEYGVQFASGYRPTG